MSESEKNRELKSLYEKYFKTVYRYCLSKINYQQCFVPLAEDCANEAFIRLMQEYEKYKDHPKKSLWLCEKAWNLMRSEIRSARNREEKLKKVYKAVPEWNPTIAEHWFEEWFQKEEFDFAVKQICQTLTAIEKQVFDSYFIKRNSLAETAGENEISENSARAAIKRIRTKLKKKYHKIFK